MMMVKFYDDLAHCDGENPLHHGEIAFGGSMFSSPRSTTCLKCQNVTLLGYDIMFLGFLYV
jgi:hypothetical protein